MDSKCHPISIGVYSKDTYWIESMPYAIVSKLLEWHFDIDGLIEKGLAIDINTLPAAAVIALCLMQNAIIRVS